MTMLMPLRILGLALSALFLGPITFAALISFLPTTERERLPSDALRLLRTFDDAFPQAIPMYSRDPDFHFRKCGYDSEAILGDITSVKQRNSWVPYEGYFDLSAWVSDKFDQGVEEARAHQLDKRLSSFELRFLNRCIANSPFSTVCGYRVRKVLEAGNLYSNSSLPSSSHRPDQSGRMRTVCAFLDGIAARKGQKLGTAQIDSE
jgi:hypothetical protein